VWKEALLNKPFTKPKNLWADNLENCRAQHNCEYKLKHFILCHHEKWLFWSIFQQRKKRSFFFPNFFWMTEIGIMILWWFKVALFHFLQIFTKWKSYPSLKGANSQFKHDKVFKKVLFNNKKGSRQPLTPGCQKITKNNSQPSVPLIRKVYLKRFLKKHVHLFLVKIEMWDLRNGTNFFEFDLKLSSFWSIDVWLLNILLVSLVKLLFDNITNVTLISVLVITLNFLFEFQ